MCLGERAHYHRGPHTTAIEFSRAVYSAREGSARGDSVSDEDFENLKMLTSGFFNLKKPSGVMTEVYEDCNPSQHARYLNICIYI
jgi:hypothetical protein